MPYSIEKTSPKCWTVKNTETGAVKAKCTSEKKAKAQMRLLYGLESGWKPKKKGKGKMENKECDQKSDTEEGGYLESFKRKPGLLPPPVRKMLDSKGSVKISSIKIVRTPLSRFVSSLLNVISLGAYQKAVKESPYDSMFHLAMLINGRYTTEKNEVIKLYQGTPVKKNSETFDLPVSKNITIGELFENGRKKMGDENFTNYDARTNNCQDFLLGLLDGSGLTTDEARKFIKQDAEVIFKKMPTVSEKIGRFLTDVGAVGERVMEGEGQSKPCWKGYEMIGMKTKNGKKVPNCVPFKETWVVQGGRLVPVLVGGEIPDDIKKLAKAKYELKKATEEYEKLLPEKDKPQLLPEYEKQKRDDIIESYNIEGKKRLEENKKIRSGDTKKKVKYYGDKDVEIHKGPFIARRSGGTDTQWTVWNVQKLLKVGLNRQQAIDLIESLYESQNLLKTTKKSSVSKKKKMPESKSWKDFYASQVKGKKFKNRQEVNAFMKECSKKWKEMKSKSGGMVAPQHVPGYMSVAQKRQLLTQFFRLVDNDDLDDNHPHVRAATNFSVRLLNTMEQRFPDFDPDWTSEELVANLPANVIADIPINTMNIIRRHRSRLSALIGAQQQAP
jgi:hypothetical protein